MADLELLNAKIDPTKAETGARDIATAFNKLRDNTKKNTKEVSDDFDRMEKSIGASLKRLGIQVLAFLSARELIDATTRWTNYTNTLRVVTQEGQLLVNTQEEILDLANRTRQSIDIVGPSFQRLTIASESLNKTQEETVRNLETINKLAAAGGGPLASQSAGVYQLNQALGSGVLAGDEFRSVMENLPVFAQELAKELGVTTGELRNLSRAQKLTSDVVIEAIEGMSDAADRLFEDVNVTLPQGFQVFTNSLTAFIGKADEAAGVSNFFAQSLQFLGLVITEIGRMVFSTEKELIGFREAMLSTDVDVISGQIAAFTNVISVNQDAIELYQENIESLADEQENLRANTEMTSAATNELADFIGDSNTELVSNGTELEKQQRKLKGVQEESTKYAAAISQLVQRLELLKQKSKPPILGLTSQQVREQERLAKQELKIALDVGKDMAQLRKRLADEQIAENFRVQEDLQKQSKEGQEKLEKQMEDHVEDLQDIVGAGFKSLFVDVFDGALDDFDSFAQALERAFVNMLAELAWQAVQNKIIVPVQTGSVSGGGGVPGGAAAGFNNPLIGAVGGVSLGFARGGVGGALGGGLGGAAGVIAAGSEAVISAIGGISTALGAVAPILLPLAGILGGSFLGGLFGGGGGGSRDPVRGANEVYVTGGFGQASGSTSNAARSSTQAIGAVANALNDMDMVLGDILSTDAIGRITEGLSSFASGQQVPEFTAEETILKRSRMIIDALDSSLLPLFDELSTGLDAGQIADLTTTFASIFQAFDDGLTVFSDISGPGALIETLDDFRNVGESLTDTLTRLVTSLGLASEVVGTLGTSLQDVQFADTLIDALGGLDTAATAITSFRQAFFSETELLTDAVNTARQNAEQAFGDIALEFTSALTRDEFREAFDAIRDSLSPEDLANWIRAGNTLHSLGLSIEALDVAATAAEPPVEDLADEVDNLGDSADRAAERARRLSDFMEPLEFDIEDFNAGLSDFEQGLVDIGRQTDRYIKQASALGASEDEIAVIREWERVQIERLTQAEQQRVQDALIAEETLRQERADAYLRDLEAFRRAVNEIEEIINTVSTNLGDLRREIEIALLPEDQRTEAQYEDLRNEANALAATISALTDADEIARVSAEVESLTRQAFGLLDEQQRQAAGQEFLNFIDEVQRITRTRLEEIRNDTLQQQPVDPFAKSSTDMLQASNQQVSASIRMQTSAETMSQAAKEFQRTVSRGIRVSVATEDGVVNG